MKTHVSPRSGHWTVELTGTERKRLMSGQEFRYTVMVAPTSRGTYIYALSLDAMVHLGSKVRVPGRRTPAGTNRERVSTAASTHMHLDAAGKINVVKNAEHEPRRVAT